MDTVTARPSVFISYSRKDGKWLDELTTMLAPVVRAGIASVWWDKKIRPSQIWRQEIDQALASARLAILLVSKHFLASDFIQDEELPFLVDAAQRRGVKLLWVLVSPCLYEHSPLRDIQAAHDPSRPLSKLRGADRQEALVSIGRAVVEALGSEAPDLASPLSRWKGGDGRGAGGEGPPLHNLPYPRLGDLFTGRQEELDALAAGGTAAITQSAAISGLGGIGKTRLAVEYAWRSGNRYTAAWFVRADSPENLRRNLAALAGPELLNLPEWEAQVEDKTVAAVKRQLRDHPGWLMILDNVDTPEAADAVLEIFPSLSKGRVLITSRLGSWPPEVRKQPLEKLSQEEAVRFLLHRTEDGRAKAADDEQRAADLAQRVDGLPLALEQAAAYILRHRMSFAEYLRAWEEEHDKLLQWYDPRVMRYPASVAVTWKQTFDRLSPTPATLLRLMAFLAPDPIPVDMFEQGEDYVEQVDLWLCEEVGKEPDELTIQDALAELADYSLTTRQDDGMLVVHRMVQEALRSQILEEHRRAWIEGALRILNNAAVEEPTDFRTWPVWDRLRPHVAEVVARADEAGIVEPTNRLMNKLADLFFAKGLFFDAEPWARRALAIEEALFGTEDPRVAKDLNSLAVLLQYTNRLEDAEPLMRRALAIEEACSGKEHPRVTSYLRNLAHIYLEQNCPGKAEPLLRRAVSIAEASLGAKDPRVAACLMTLAWLLKDTNRLIEAESLMRRVLAIDEASFGTERSVARDLGSLAWLLQDTNRLGEAEPLLRRAVEISKESLGPEHPWTQAAQRNLESLLAKIAASAPGEDDPAAPEAL